MLSAVCPLELITRGLDECQLNANRIMAISGHRSEKQMRKDYNDEQIRVHGVLLVG